MAEKKKSHKGKVRANGEGTLFQRKSDNLWVGRIPNGYKPDGSIRYITITGKLQSTVLEKMKKIKADIQNNAYVEPTKITVKEWLDTWLNITIKESIKNTTWLSYEAMIRLHIIPEIGGIKLMQLQTCDLQKLYNDKLKSGRKDKQKVDGKIVTKAGGLSPKTIRYIHTIISSALKQAVNERIIQINVAEYVKLPKNPKKEMKTLDIQDIRKFLEAAKASRYYTAFFLELYTGLRRGELLGLRWKDVDMKKGRIKVVQQLVKEGNNHVIRELKTESSQNRVISIPDEVMSVIKEQKAKQEIELKAMGKNDIQVAEYNKTGLIFTTEDGKYVQPRCFDRYFKAILKAAGLQDIRFHDLRHTFALISLQAGADIKTLQNDLGHESIETTLDKYGHVNEEMKRDASNRRSELLKSVVNKT